MDVFIWINVLGSLNMNIFVHKLAFGQGQECKFHKGRNVGVLPTSCITRAKNST